MLIWLALIIPFVTVGILVYGFKRNIIWWELIVPVAVSFVVIIAFKLSCQSLQTRDTEYWGGYITEAAYYEDYDEEVACRHPHYVTKTETYTDSDGDTQTRTVTVQEGWEHAYDVDYHGPSWELTGSNGETFNVDQSDYLRLVSQFGNNPQFVDLNRDYHSHDGDKYVALWDGQDSSLEPVITKHAYENRIQATTHSIYKFEEVDPKEYHLFEYPDIEGYYDCPTILGYHGPDRAEAERKLTLLNAKLGAPKKVRIWVLVFKDKPIRAAFEQQNYWKGGNKNELIITVGINKAREVMWSHVFSWSEVESLKIDTRDFLNHQKKLDLVALADWIGPEIQDRFVKRDFREFNYLTVEPPLWAIYLTFFVTLLVNVGISFWLITNQYEEGSETLIRRPRYQSYYSSRF